DTDFLSLHQHRSILIRQAALLSAAAILAETCSTADFTGSAARCAVNGGGGQNVLHGDKPLRPSQSLPSPPKRDAVHLVRHVRAILSVTTRRDRTAGSIIFRPPTMPKPALPEHIGGDGISIRSAICPTDSNLRSMHHNTQPHRAALAYARSRGSSCVCDKTNASIMRATSLAC